MMSNIENLEMLSKSTTPTLFSWKVVSRLQLKSGSVIVKSLLKQPVEAKASAAQLGHSLLANGGKGSAEYGMRNQQSVEFEYGA